MPQSNNIPKLADQADVTLTSPADNDVLAYDSGTSKMINQTAAQAGLAAASHTHTASEITDFTEAAQDAVLAVVADSSSIDVTYNDAGNSFSIAVLPAGVDHNSLANLTSGDPHTQYLKTDGSRALGGDQNANSHKIVNLATPTAGTDAATKEYVDASIRGLKWKDNVRVMATGNVDISTGLAAGSVVDGVTLVLNDRVALPLQSTGSQRGLYLVPASGAASRTADLAAGVSAAGITFVVEEGTNADKQFVCTNDVGSDVVGTATLAFSQIGGGGTGVTSVALTGTAIFTITGSPITSSGTLDIQFASQTANKFLASPDGSSGALTVRAIVAADLPTISHASLSNLSADDHTQYAKADGSRGTFGGWQWVVPVIAASKTNVNISGGGLAVGSVVGGVTLSLNNRVVLMGQSDPIENGIYPAPASGGATRAADLPAGVLADNVVVIVGRGDYADRAFQQTANGCTVGTDAQTWQDFPRVTDITAAAVKYGATYQPFNSLTDGATVTIDWSLGNKHKVTLGGSRTFAFSNTTAGQAIRLQIKQDATGSRTVTWPSGISWFGGSAPTLTTTANKTDEVVLECTAAGSAYDGYLVGTNK